MPDPIRVLIVDDAVVVRKAVSKALASDPEISVIGTAADGKIALAKIKQLKPDVVILDIEMPECDGFEVLRVLRRERSRVWTLMFSTLTQRGAAQTIDALSLGAHDYVSKPTTCTGVNGYQEGIKKVASELIPKIKRFKNKVRSLQGKTISAVKKSRPMIRIKSAQIPEVVAIGISTGGPEALSSLLPQFSKTFPSPILIVQHMPKLFTKLLADRLDAGSKIKVREGAEGMVLEPGVAYIAPGDFHLSVRRNGTKTKIALSKEAPENSCRPAADFLFRSVAEIFGKHVLGVIMTGMGQDGLKGLRTIKAKGGTVFAQDEATSVVWGMPSAVVNEGLANFVLPLDRMSSAIEECFAK